jgi:hypothetical protein
MQYEGVLLGTTQARSLRLADSYQRCGHTHSADRSRSLRSPSAFQTSNTERTKTDPRYTPPMPIFVTCNDSVANDAPTFINNLVSQPKTYAPYKPAIQLSWLPACTFGASRIFQSLILAAPY